MKQQDRAVVKSVSFNIPTSQEMPKKCSSAKYQKYPLNSWIAKQMVSPDHIWAVIRHKKGSTFLGWKNGLTRSQLFQIHFRILVQGIHSVDRNNQWGDAHVKHLPQISVQLPHRHSRLVHGPNTWDWVHYLVQLPHSNVLEIKSAETSESIWEILWMVGNIGAFTAQCGKMIQMRSEALNAQKKMWNCVPSVHPLWRAHSCWWRIRSVDKKNGPVWLGKNQLVGCLTHVGQLVGFNWTSDGQPFIANWMDLPG